MQMMWNAPADTQAALAGLDPKYMNPSLFAGRMLLPMGYGLGDRSEDKENKEIALQTLCGMGVPNQASNYGKKFFRIVSRTPCEKIIVFGRLKSRLAVNLGDGLLENAGIALHRNTGLPFIPGSAVKGCCSHACYWMQKEGLLPEGIRERIFGESAAEQGSRQGSFFFLPAFPVAGGGLERDILTPHGNGITDDPMPHKFPAIEAGAVFMFAILASPRACTESGKTDLNSLKTILLKAFENGLGAKSAAGMGWFVESPDTEQELYGELEAENEEKRAERAAAAQAAADRDAAERREKDRLKEQQEQEENRLRNEREKAEEEKRRAAQLDEMSPHQRRVEELKVISKDDFLKLLRGILEANEPEQRALLEVLRSKNPKKRKQFLRDKKIASGVREVAETLGEESI